MNKNQDKSETCFPRTNLKGLITLCVVPLAFLIYHGFFSRFTLCLQYQQVGIQNVSENTRKKLKMRAQRKKMFLYYTMHWAKMQVSGVLLRFGLVLAWVWLGFGLGFAHKPYQNSNPTHSVIWP